MAADTLRKPDLYVVARMIERLLRNGGSYGKTRFQSACGLNYETYQRYLTWMVAKDLVRLADGKDGPEVRLAPRGLEAYHHVVAWIKDALGVALA